MADHNTLTGSQLHEPKGIDSSATSDSGKVLTPSASSAGTGTLRYLTESEITGKTEYLTAVFDDVSTAGDLLIPVPFSGTVTSVRTVISGTIATADVTLTAKVNSSAMTDGDVLIEYSGSAAGDIDSCTPTAGNTVSTTDYITISSDGASTNTVSASIVITLSRS